MIRDLTQGPVVPLLFRFALPLFVSNALQAVYSLVDMIIVGNYIGKAGMSAVSIADVISSSFAAPRYSASVISCQSRVYSESNSSSSRPWVAVSASPP